MLNIRQTQTVAVLEYLKRFMNFAWFTQNSGGRSTDNQAPAPARQGDISRS
jgi:hypothetical protein